MMFNYIQFSCIECEKPLEYVVPSNVTTAKTLDTIDPLPAMILTGTSVICSCGKSNDLKYNEESKKLEVS